MLAMVDVTAGPTVDAACFEAATSTATATALSTLVSSSVAMLATAGVVVSSAPSCRDDEVAGSSASGESAVDDAESAADVDDVRVLSRSAGKAIRRMEPKRVSKRELVVPKPSRVSSLTKESPSAFKVTMDE
jgi:hypothetical protein